MAWKRSTVQSRYGPPKNLTLIGEIFCFLDGFSKNVYIEIIKSPISSLSPTLPHRGGEGGGLN